MVDKNIEIEIFYILLMKKWDTSNKLVLQFIDPQSKSHKLLKNTGKCMAISYGIRKKS